LRWALAISFCIFSKACALFASSFICAHKSNGREISLHPHHKYYNKMSS
jgi:hypothetical protein